MKLQNFQKNEHAKKITLEQFHGNDDWLKKASILSEALPYMQRFAGETFIIKYGGAAMTDKSLSAAFAHDIVLLKQIGINPVIVHGGGKKINEVLAMLNINSKFINGLRVTDQATIEVVEMVLCGLVNKNITQQINAAGGSAIGLSGKDCNLIEAKKLFLTYKENRSNNVEKILDMGFVGEPNVVNPDILFFIEESDFIPVIAPVCGGEGGMTYNVNADSVASAITTAISASKLIMLSNVRGVADGDGNTISEMSTKEASELIEKGIATEGMIPKLSSCIKTVKEGCGVAHIVDGRVPHVLLLELFTEHGTGTMIVDDPANL